MSKGLSKLEVARFRVSEAERRVQVAQVMTRDFEQMISALNEQIEAEHKRTGISDANNFAYSTVAKAATIRRINIENSLSEVHEHLAVLGDRLETVKQEMQKTERLLTGGQTPGGMVQPHMARA